MPAELQIRAAAAVFRDPAQLAAFVLVDRARIAFGRPTSNMRVIARRATHA